MMRDLQYQLKQLCERNKEGSFATRAQRERMLALIADQLWQMGYRALDVHGLKGRHVNRLVARWQEEHLSPGTMKNRLSVLRWWADKIDHGHMLKPDNDGYGIPKRRTVASVSKAIDVTPEQLRRIRDPYVRMSVELQRAFGLRREEAIKIRPAYADRGDTLVLKGSWTKGGKSRSIPIRTDAQRVLLDRAHRLAGGGALIPPDKNYREQLNRYKYELTRVGIYQAHGLRHAYAAERYAELTGQAAPVAGGEAPRTEDERRADHDARMTVSQELGHERKHITGAYLGAITPKQKRTAGRN
jgi:hypothetical protein